MLLFLCQSIVAQNKTPTNDSPSQNDLGIFALPPFERAVRCIKYYEGWHDIKRNYPYIGWGHRILPHEKFKKNLTYQQADSLLRSDLTKLCAMFRKYGKDSLLLAVLAYNVGPYKISEEPSLTHDRAREKRHQTRISGLLQIPKAQDGLYTQEKANRTAIIISDTYCKKVTFLVIIHVFYIET